MIPISYCVRIEVNVVKQACYYNHYSLLISSVDKNRSGSHLSSSRVLPYVSICMTCSTSSNLDSQAAFVGLNTKEKQL